jgi:hypothetical protein
MARVFSFSGPPLKKYDEKKLIIGVKVTQLTQRHPAKIAERPMKTPF